MKNLNFCLRCFCAVVAGFLCADRAAAQEATYLEEVQALGSISGQGLACDATKYQTFELLARAIMISKAASDGVQEQGMKAYNDYKARSFISVVKDGFRDCDSIVRRFDKQQIFKSTLYGDGTIKMPDGKIITPRHPYDATKVYEKDPNARENYLNMYHARLKKVTSDPKVQRALREKQLQSGY